jgi:tetratricopeptide (TPR) repeat protein
LANFYRAIELDPGFAAAYGMAARAYFLRKGSGWAANRDVEVAEAARLARRAAELGKDDAVALGGAGLALSFVVGDHDEGKALTDRAVTLNPNLAWIWLFSGWVRVWFGESEAAIDRVSRALRLNPADPHSYSMYSALGFCPFFCRSIFRGCVLGGNGCAGETQLSLATCLASASNALAGRPRDAERAMARVRQLVRPSDYRP